MYRYLPLLLVTMLPSCSTEPQPLSVPSPASQASELPALHSDEQGNLLLSWVEHTGEGDSVSLRYSNWTDGDWSASREIAAGDDWFVNWADFPRIVASAGNPVAAHWLQKVPGGPYSYNVQMRMYRPGQGWGTPLTPHRDGTPTEHGFVSLLPRAERSVLAIWLDGRNTMGRPAEEYGDLDKAMSLRSAVISADGTVSGAAEIDAAVCDCCQTSVTGIPGGAIAAYRNRTEGEIRDIYTSRYISGAWSEPVPVHDDGWQINACPVNGPALASADSTVVLAWYTGAENDFRVRAAVSRNAGKTFSEPVDIDQGNPIGRVGAAVTADGRIWVSWMEKESVDGAQIRVRQIDGNGILEPAITVSPIDASRSSGFPQMTASGNSLWFAWTETGEQNRVRTAVIRL